MRRVICMSAAGLLLISCANVSTPSIAGEKPNIVIMGEDVDKDTVPRNSRVFRRVLDALSNQLNEEGFDVFDETAVTLDKFAQGRTRRTDVEIVDIARSVKRPPLDVAVIFQIYASADQLTYTTKVKTRITGRLLAVKTGQRLGNFEVDSPGEWVAPVKCPRECILEVVGTHARILANDLGAVLTAKLAHLIDSGENVANLKTGGIPQAYIMVFDGFNETDINDIEEYLVVFSGYKRHRPTYSSPRRHEVWYESDISSGRLNRNLKKMLDHLDLRGTVTFSGNSFTVKKITFRKRRVINRKEW
jgi:hypothetical protein